MVSVNSSCALYSMICNNYEIRIKFEMRRGCKSFVQYRAKMYLEAVTVEEILAFFFSPFKI